MTAFTAPNLLILREAPAHLSLCATSKRKFCAFSTPRASARENAGMRRATAEFEAELAAVERKYGPRGSRISKRAEAEEKSIAEYNALRKRLAWDTAFIASIITCGAWGFGSPSAVVSTVLGGAGAMVYVFLLSRGVDRIADGAKSGARGGDGGQASRTALLVVLIALVGRSGGRLEFLPTILGFFAYKIAFVLPLISGEAFVD